MGAKTLFRLVVAFAVIPAVFVATFDLNLHCTQHTSFRTAIFDLMPHEEELPPPLIYLPPYRIGLRAVLAAVLLAFLFMPSASVCWLRRRGPTRAQWWALGIAAGLFAGVLFVPERIVGERVIGLYYAAAVIGSMLYAAVMLVLLRVRGPVRRGD